MMRYVNLLFTYLLAIDFVLEQLFINVWYVSFTLQLN